MTPVVAKCPGTTVALIVNGKRTCQAAAVGRADVVATANGAAWISPVAGVRATLFPHPKAKPGVTIAPSLTPANAARIRRSMVVAQGRALAQAPLLFGARWPKGARPAAAFRSLPTAGDGVTIGPMTGTVISQTPSSIEGRVSAPITVVDSAGKTLMTGNVGMTIGAEASIEGAPASMVISVDVETTVNEKTGPGTIKKTNGFGAKFKVGSVDPCPSATGDIDVTQKTGWSQTETRVGTIGPIKVGHLRIGSSGQSQLHAVGHMGPDARLTGISYTYSESIDHTESGNVLALASSISRGGVRVSATGVLDPATGLPRAGSQMSVTTTAYGMADDAIARAQLGAKGDDLLRERLGQLLTQVREVEANARAGRCTTIELTPGSVATLQPSATLSLGAVLRTNEKHVDVTPVRWGVVAAKGGVAPGTSQDAKPTFTVTGAPAGPQTAALTVKAVSPAGISTVQWSATGTDFPASYSGHLTYQDDQGPGLVTTAWDADASYTRTSTQTNPDGSRSAWYSLTTLTVGAFTQTTTYGPCTYSVANFGAAAIKAGDIEIQVDTHGSWSAGVLVDGSLGSHSLTCPPPFTSGGAGEIKTFLNTRTPNLGLRTIAAPESTTPISGTNVTDLESLPAVVGTASASWNLVPKA